MRAPSILILALCCAGCATTEEPEPTGRPPEADGRRYLEEGPTVALDTEERDAAPTPLQRLQQQEAELQRTRSRISELEAALQAAERRAAEAEQAQQATDADAQRIRSLLEDAYAEQRQLTERLVSARIARLRTEQEMIRIKLADLVQEPR